ncbi:hypothetical protein BH24DEI2_BH24DEI2_09130 [soil metagenome]
MDLKAFSFGTVLFTVLTLLLAACNSDPAVSPALTVNFLGAGSGKVTLQTPNVVGNDYRQDFTEPFPAGETVEVTAVANEGSVFTGWAGDCSDLSAPVCEVVMNGDRNVRATFAEKTSSSSRLTVDFLGQGSGTVVLSEQGKENVSYRQGFSASFSTGETVELKAVADDGSRFTGWAGDCTNGAGEPTCQLVMNADKNVRVTFDRGGAESFDLEVTKMGNGVVTSSPAGINCGTDCRETYATGSVVTLSATSEAGFRFSGWSGACTGTSICTVTMNATQTVAALFEPLPVQSVTLSVFPLGAGYGTVRSDPAGIACGSGSDAGCDSSFAPGSPVTLTATAAVGSVFAAWRGCASSTNVCTLTPTSDKQVTAIFNEGNATGRTFLVPIVRGSDDAEQYLSEALRVPREKGDQPYEDFAANAVDIKSGDLDLTYNTDYVKVDQLVGLRFSDLSIPPGATILDARIQFTVDHPTGGYVKLYIHGQADPKALTFVHQGIGDISDRPQTAAVVTWEPPAWNSPEGTVNDRAALTPNLAAIVQEVVDLPGWEKRANGLVFVIAGDAANATERRRAVSFEDSDTNARLLVTYSN